MTNLITLRDPRSAASEAYRTLRTNLMFSNVDAQIQCFAVSSPSKDEGKSITLANLAVTFAQAGHTTLIVDADLRQPQQHTLWNLNNDSGLTDLLLNDSATPAIQQTEVDGLGVLTSGSLPANPADVLASKRMDEVITGLTAQADFLLFDVPPILAVTDAAVLSRKLDGIVMVAQTGKTRRDALQRAKEQLHRVQVNLIGAVLTNAPTVNQQY